MARLTDVFNNDQSNTDNSSNTGADQNADSGQSAANEGISLQQESAETDEDGNSSSDSLGLDVGGTDLGNTVDVDSMVDNMTDSSGSSDGSELADS